MLRKLGLLTVLLAFASLLLVAGAHAAPKPKGQTCGGIVPIQCPFRAFCEFRTGVCGKGDQTGTCAPREDACPQQIVRPVCGCDNKTYSNDCMRRMAGVSKLHNGKCKAAY
jgi:hypothetical protein